MASESSFGLLPLIIGIATSQDPDSQSGNRVRDQIVVFDPETHNIIMFDAGNLEVMFQEFSGKDGQSPASKKSIDAMPTVKVTEIGGECVICLEEHEVGGEVREMPCKHRFHSGCIEKWLGIHGSCPICRYEMPVEEEKKGGGGDGDGDGDVEGGERRDEREIRISVWIGRGRRTSSDSGRDSDSNPESGADENAEVDGSSAEDMDWID